MQRPHPPICIGGAGERRTLPAVARWAQHWNYPGFDRDGLMAKLEKLHEACATIGRDPAEIMISQHIPYDPDAGPSALADDIAGRDEIGLDLAIVYLPPPHDPAVLAPMAEALAEVE